MRLPKASPSISASPPKGRYCPFRAGARQPPSITELFALVILALCQLQPVAAGEVFRWKDAEGKQHFSDRPSATSEKLQIKDSTRFSDAGPGSWRKIQRVYDGDTVVLEGGEKVRLLSINTPEITGSYRDGEPGGQEAKAWLAAKIAGRRVRLETDNEAKDRYGRTLAYLFAEDGTHLNLALVQSGLATTDIYPPNLKYVDAFVRAEREAESQRKGLWAMSAYRPKTLDGHLDADLEGWQRLTGTPSSLAKGRNFMGLRFGERLEVRIPKNQMGLFPPLGSYIGQKLEVRGWLSRRSRKPALWVRHPSALVKR